MPAVPHPDDREEVRTFYGWANLQIRLFGAEGLGREYVLIRLDRFHVNGHLDYSRLRHILSQIKHLDAWYPVWSREADDEMERARQAAKADRTVSAADHFLRASMLYHFGAYLTRPGTPERTAGKDLRVKAYRDAVRLREDIEPVEISLGSHRLPGYLHRPPGPAKPPCVIMIPGADSVKEEYHNWAAQFVRRGLAVLAFDGPGQGESLTRGIYMRPERYEEAITAVVDFLAQRSDVDAARVGAWGSSMGGFLVARAAAFEHRLRCAVSLGGFYDFRDFSRWYLSTQINVQEDLGTPTLRETRDYVAARCSLEGVADKIACPFLVIHGALDELVTTDEARQMAEEAPRGEFVLFEDAYHTCTNQSARLVPLMCDWVAEKLRG
jgi:2,6-dihydroxypseudooxynicotine hydrolase